MPELLSEDLAECIGQINRLIRFDCLYKEEPCETLVPGPLHNVPHEMPPYDLSNGDAVPLVVIVKIQRKLISDTRHHPQHGRNRKGINHFIRAGCNLLEDVNLIRNIVSHRRRSTLTIPERNGWTGRNIAIVEKGYASRFEGSLYRDQRDFPRRSRSPLKVDNGAERHPRNIGKLLPWPLDQRPRGAALCRSNHKKHLVALFVLTYFARCCI